ncbi:hypothetical protein J7K44_00800 [bacterium]|nr:hypothetical protein [bacterium]
MTQVEEKNLSGMEKLDNNYFLRIFKKKIRKEFIMTNVFVAFTPYHVLLSYVIASENNEKNCLIVINDSANLKELVEAIKKEKNSPFSDFVFLPGMYGKKNMMQRRLIIRNNIKTLKRIINNIVIKRAYVCHDGRPESQLILSYAKHNNAPGIYIEDGSGAYGSLALRRRKIKILLGKIIYGRWWEDVKILGTSSYIDQIIAIFPEDIRPELRKKAKILGVNRERFLSLKNKSFVTSFLKKIGINKEYISDIDIIIIISHSEFARQYPRYKELIVETISQLKEKNIYKNIAVKYHPREKNDFLNLATFSDIKILPQAIPAEILFLIASNSLRLIIGDASTSLLTAKWLFPHIKVASFVEQIKGDKKLVDFLKTKDVLIL